MNDPFKLSGKRAVVIGGSSGIGKALALGLGQAGVRTVVSSRSAVECEKVAAQIRGTGGRSLSAQVDIVSRQSVQVLHDTVLKQLGGIDILVNCAGITQRIPTLDCSEDLWQKIFEVNLNGTLRACQIFGATMIAAAAGRIINIASLATFVAFHEVAAYGASKAAVGALTRSLAVEWAPYGVTVNAIAPGIVPTALNSAILDSPRGHELTRRTPIGRFGRAEEMVSAALYLASEASSFTTGQILTVDGGFLASGVNQ